MYVFIGTWVCAFEYFSNKIISDSTNLVTLFRHDLKKSKIIKTDWISKTKENIEKRKKETNEIASKSDTVQRWMDKCSFCIFDAVVKR